MRRMLHLEYPGYIEPLDPFVPFYRNLSFARAPVPQSYYRSSSPEPYQYHIANYRSFTSEPDPYN